MQRRARIDVSALCQHHVLTHSANQYQCNPLQQRCGSLMSLFAFSAVQTEVCQKIISGLSQECDESFSRHVSIVSQDCFYKSLDPSEKAQADQGEYNFDHPGESVVCLIHV